MGDISVIIPVYNEERFIGRCLESLEKQTVKPKEVIVVDDGSSDTTVDVASKFEIRNSKFEIVRSAHRGAGAARNLGTKKAKGEILVFVDADMRFSPTFLEDLTAPIRVGKSKGTFSKLELIANWNNRLARYWNYRRKIYEPRAVPRNFPDKSPVFRAILKREFDKAGGFDETKGYTDDWSLSQRLGYKATATKARYYHDNPASLKEVFGQARWTGKRRFKLGLLGIFGALGKGILGLGLNVSEPAENWFSMLVLSPAFLVAYGAGMVIGAAEYYLGGRVAK